MRKIINDAINFGMGVTAQSKEKLEALAVKIQKKCGATKRESEQMVKDIITRGEKIRKEFEKNLLETQSELFEKLEKFAGAEKKKAQSKVKAQTKKPAPKKPATKKATKKAKPASKKA